MKNAILLPQLHTESADKTQFDCPCLANLQIYLQTYFREEYATSFVMNCDAGDVPCTDTPKPTDTSELKKALQAIWTYMPQGSINAAILLFRKRLQSCKKQPVDISNMLSELMLLASTCLVSLQ